MKKHNKKANAKSDDFLSKEAEEFAKTAPEYTLDIPEDEIWTYQIEGLSAPRIGKPVANAAVKKTIIIVSLLIAIGLSVFLSIQAIHSDTFDYLELNDGTYQLEKFSNPGDIKELVIDYADDEKTKPVTQIREYAFNCDEMITQIKIGADVRQLESSSFYTCRALENIYVDKDNPYYCDIDGVLYSKDVTELICYPIDHDNYLRRERGYDFEADNNENPVEKLIGKNASYDEAFLKKYNEDVRTYVVPSTVKVIKQMALNYADITDLYLPEGLEKIETLAVFRCTALKNIYSYKSGGSAETGAVTAASLGGIYPSLPDGLEYIGSDAFSYNQELTYMFIPSSVNYIGHHAFWDTCYKSDGEIKGVSQMNVAADEAVFTEKTYLGDQWCPKYDYRMFKKTIPVNYSAARDTE